MPSTMPDRSSARPRVIGEKRSAMLKADLPKRERRQILADIGACLDEARRVVGWTVDQLAAELERDSKQVGRWMRGEERTQVDVVFGIEVLRGPFVIALAKLAKCEVETTVRIKLSA
jgi:ribosome-binding protein aMBF1 (putative translation factor)